MESKLKITASHFNLYLSPIINSAIHGNTDDVEFRAKRMLQDASIDISLKRTIEHAFNTKARTITLPNDISDMLHRKNNCMELKNIVMSAENTLYVKNFLKQFQLKDVLLAKYNLSPSNRILMHGAPGNGKTSIASAIAKELELPYFVMDFSSIVSSKLGETGAKIAKIFDFVSTQENGCVLFLDELDTVLTERAGVKSRSDVSEMSRVVTTLLMQIDRLPSSVILIGATNHRDLLDTAVSRRFENTWHIANPNPSMIDEYIGILSQKINIPLKKLNIEGMEGLSISDIENKVLVKAREWAIKELLSESSEGDVA